MNICTDDGKVLPSRQVSDDDSCRRINSAVMKIRLFKPKTLSNTEISITVEVFNSPAHFCLKGNNLHNRKSPTCGRRRPSNLCLKGRTSELRIISYRPVCNEYVYPNFGNISKKTIVA